MSSFRKAKIFIKGVFAGLLLETDEGYSFRYDEEYLKSSDAFPASLTLPLQEGEFKSKSLFPFFDGLIPEGWLLSVVSRNWKVNLNDRFGLLLVSCKDSVGCVSVEESYE